MSENWQQLVGMAKREVSATLQSLPAPLRAKARQLPVTYEPWPNEALVADGIEPDTLGLFVGGDYAEEEHQVIPAQIILFLESIWDMVEGDEAEQFWITSPDLEGTMI